MLFRSNILNLVCNYHLTNVFLSHLFPDNYDVTNKLSHNKSSDIKSLFFRQFTELCLVRV